MGVTVFTNGCFDILHAGHVDLLRRARGLGDRLVVGINSDSSVRRIKGSRRPLVDENSRRAVLLALESVDEVFIFQELTPELLIRQVQPDVLVKGGDWSPDEIIGADFVTKRGGKVFSLPLHGVHSSSSIIANADNDEASTNSNAEGSIGASLNEHDATMLLLRKHSIESIRECARLIVETFRNGNKILICGNGGSAADAQHIAAEFVGRYEAERRSLPALALTTDTSALTALGNDYDFERIFARQVEGLANKDDCLIAISTSGTSRNVLAAVMEARRRGCKVIGMTGENGKKLASLTDACLVVPASRTARIQEAHITAAHIWCEIVDREFSEVPKQLP